MNYSHSLASRLASNAWRRPALMMRDCILISVVWTHGAVADEWGASGYPPRVASTPAATLMTPIASQPETHRPFPTFGQSTSRPEPVSLFPDHAAHVHEVGNTYSATPEPFTVQSAAVVRHARGPVAETRLAPPRFEPLQPQVQSWLTSVTPSTYVSEARKLILQARHEFTVGAYASAEASTWDAMRQFANAIDASSHAYATNASASSNSAALDLQIAEQAFREARDFAGKYGVDQASIERLVRCHQTKVLKDSLYYNMTAAEAIDRYMNEARLKLSPLAAQSPEFADAMGLLAAITLGRRAPHSLPNETSLCLRRAAFQGQPGNPQLASQLGAQLATLGLHDEGVWALQHSLSIHNHPRTMLAMAELLRHGGNMGAAEQWRVAAQQAGAPASESGQSVPQVVQLTPAEFASISQPVMFQGAPAAPAPSPIASPTGPVIKQVSANTSTFGHASAPPRTPQTQTQTQTRSGMAEDVTEPADSPSAISSFMRRIGVSR